MRIEIISLVAILVFSCGSAEGQKETNTTEVDSVETIEESENLFGAAHSNDPGLSDLEFIEERFREFVMMVDDGDKEGVAKMIQYPLSRSNPIPNIETEEEFIEAFDRIIDENLKEILQSIVDDPEINIIDRSGATGNYGFLNGQIWFGYDGKIVSINYSGEEESKLYHSTNESIQDLLPASLSSFESNVYMGATEKHVIRIDEVDNGYRYASWSIGVSCQNEPDLIIEGGEAERQGTGGGWWYTFKNGAYTYYYRDIWMGESEESTGEFLVIENDGEVIGDLRLTEISNQLEFIKSN